HDSSPVHRSSPLVFTSLHHLDDCAAQNLTAFERLTGLVDFLQREATADQSLQGQFALLEPAHVHREISLRIRRAAVRTSIDLAARQDIAEHANADLLARYTHLDGRAAFGAPAWDGRTHGWQELSDRLRSTNCIECKINAAVGEFPDLFAGVA